jgi:hypothetical protein
MVSIGDNSGGINKRGAKIAAKWPVLIPVFEIAT